MWWKTRKSFLFRKLDPSVRSTNRPSGTSSWIERNRYMKWKKWPSLIFSAQFGLNLNRFPGDFFVGPDSLTQFANTNTINSLTQDVFLSSLANFWRKITKNMTTLKLNQELTSKQYSQNLIIVKNYWSLLVVLDVIRQSLQSVSYICAKKFYRLSNAKCKIFKNKKLIFPIDLSKILHLGLPTR